MTTPTRFDAANLSHLARQICKAQGLTPRWFEVRNANKPALLLNWDDPDYDVLVVGNSKRSITITAGEMFHQNHLNS